MAQAFREVYAPYEAMIRGEGSDPLSAISNLFQTAYQLRSAPGPQKAKLVADLVREFGVDINLLDQAIVGAPQKQQPQQHQPQQPQPMRDPRFDQLLSVIERQRQEAADGEVAQFASNHEFLNDVRDEMADLIEVAARRGVDLSLEDAYNQACRLHPEIARVVDQRERAKAAGAAQQRGARSRQAASSVRGTPTAQPPRDSGKMSLRDSILASMEDAGS